MVTVDNSEPLTKARLSATPRIMIDRFEAAQATRSAGVSDSLPKSLQKSLSHPHH